MGRSLGTKLRYVRNSVFWNAEQLASSAVRGMMSDPFTMRQHVTTAIDLRRRSYDAVAMACAASSAASIRAEAADIGRAFPTHDIDHLHELDLPLAPFPVALGGTDLWRDPDTLQAVLTILGRGSLTLGRLYEGHVNAVALIARYGTPANLALLKRETNEGRLSGVWMAGQPLKLHRSVEGCLTLHGQKILCSGAGHIRRPLVAAELDGGSVMVIPNVGAYTADISGWTAQGMQATDTGTVDFAGVSVSEDEIVGQPGDYLRSPYFRGGAWRVIAVQLGGLEAILDLYKAQLLESAHCEHPIQLARFGEAVIACETASLWVRQASVIAEGSFENADAIDAYVDMARNAFECAALAVVALAQKAIGLKAFLRPNPLERIIRDLTTYLRQPALDASLISSAAFHLHAPPGGCNDRG